MEIIQWIQNYSVMLVGGEEYESTASLLRGKPWAPSDCPGYANKFSVSEVPIWWWITNPGGFEMLNVLPLIAINPSSTQTWIGNNS